MGSEKITETQLPAEIAQLSRVERNLKGLGAQRFPKLMAWVTARTTVAVDPEVLTKFGTDLTVLSLNKTLPNTYCSQEACETLLKLVQREPWRSIALLGPTDIVRHYDVGLAPKIRARAE